MKWINLNLMIYHFIKLCARLVLDKPLFTRSKCWTGKEMNIEKVYRFSLKQKHCDCPFSNLSKVFGLYTDLKGCYSLSLSHSLRHILTFTRVRNHLSLFSIVLSIYSAFILNPLIQYHYLGKHFALKMESKTKF